MLNFRKLRQDFAPHILREGKSLFDKGGVHGAKILKLSGDSLRVLGKVTGQFDHSYACELEIDRQASTSIDSDCECPSKYDCQHQAALIFFLEEHLSESVVEYSKVNALKEEVEGGEEEKKKIRETIREAEEKTDHKKGKKLQKELIEGYIKSSEVLGKSPFFSKDRTNEHDRAEVALIFQDKKEIEVQLALRLPYRSKPLYIVNLKEFLDAVRFEEPLYIANKRFFFNADSFGPAGFALLKALIASLEFPEVKGEKNYRFGLIDPHDFGAILEECFNYSLKEEGSAQLGLNEDGQRPMSGLFFQDIETPLYYSPSFAKIHFDLDYLPSELPKMMLKPHVELGDGTRVPLEEVHLFESTRPGMIHKNVYYRFRPEIKRRHLNGLQAFFNLTIPEPLFGTFVENSLPELLAYADVSNREVIEKFVTIPYVKSINTECNISYLEGEFEAELHFVYGGVKVPLAAFTKEASTILTFVTKEGILARNLTEEQKVIEDLFQDFIFDASKGIFRAKSDKKIVEFMTETIPRFKDSVKFHCPENLLDRFIYDDTKFSLHFKESSRIDTYMLELKVDGSLKGISLDLLWECLASRRPYVELVEKKGVKKHEAQKPPKILVINLERLAPVLQIFDEIGVKELVDSKEEKPLFSLASIEPKIFEGLPIEFSITEALLDIQGEMLGKKPFSPSPIPDDVKATLRPYQQQGVEWLERLRKMRLSGILADDMGLGKTLQAITALSQDKASLRKHPAVVICPTSLVYNWKEELHRFNPKLKSHVIDGPPNTRKKALAEIPHHDVVITSYSLLQKDIEAYTAHTFSYAILDEAQAIKNRGTRNAKSVKMLNAAHRLILSGTPIENSLDELWSLFDFLMPGLLGSYDRFLEKYVRSSSQNGLDGLEALKKKVSPFILRRMKEDVLSDLPPISDIVYHCHLSETQKELYRSYATSAKQELSKLVKKEGFDKVQIHVLATLTRLKQICCHPALFAREEVLPNDSAKYDMLLELIQTLIEGRHRTVIFSQYSKMLQILKADLAKLGIPFEYLDGTTKNRLGIVKRFNEDASIPLFLVSLKAGGAGLNLVGADSVIHYDMWWNPAVENQATDRVHRIGQSKSVSSYKLVTLNSIEEKIVEMQNRKKELVRHVVTSDEEAITKLTWDEVLELLEV